MALNVRQATAFYEATIKVNSEDGIVLNEVAKLYDEWQIRKGNRDRSQPASFYPVLHSWCVNKDPSAVVEQASNNIRMIRGFSWKTPEIERLVKIFIKGTGATNENLPIINELFQPLIAISDTFQQGS